MKLSWLFLPCALAAFLSGQAIAHAESDIPVQQVDQELRTKLPKAILDSGHVVVVNTGSFPPYEIVSDNRELSGASADMGHALGQLLGIEFKHETVVGVSSVIIGLKSGRYHFGMGPVGDYPERQVSNDFVDYIREQVAFAVPHGNPNKIVDLASTCGFRIAVMAGGSAEKVAKQQVETCKKEGKPVLTVQSFGDQPTSLLAVRSRRSDAYFSSLAPLTYFVKQTNGALEIAGVNQYNGFADIYQGAILPKGSPLAPILLEALQKLYANGTYELIMRKWGLESNMLKTPGINLAQEAK